MRHGFLTLAICLLLAACGGGPDYRSYPQSAPPPSTTKVKIGKPYNINGIWYYPKDEIAYDEVGDASWYGPGFHGKATASGERYDQNALTAAHRTLPLPSYVEVTNLSNGRRVILKVNDRGPFAKGRIIDVSRRAAQLLDFQNKGVERVRVRRTDRHGNPLIIPRNEPRYVERGESYAAYSGPLFVQVGSFVNYDNAHRLQARLADLGAVSLEAAMVEGQTTYRVRIGPFAGEDEAASVLTAVHGRGFYEARLVSQQNS